MPILSLILSASIVISPAFGCKGINAVPVPKTKLSDSILKAEQNLAKHVLVIINGNSDMSKEIGNYYVKKRQIPSENVITVSAPITENTDGAAFFQTVVQPVKEFIKNDKNSIDYIVTTKGDPLIVNGYSADAVLVAMDLIPEAKFTKNFSMNFRHNPYFGKSEPFSHKEFNMYLVDRLDGYTLQDVKALVDHSLQAKPEQGLFFFQGSPLRTTQSFGTLQSTMTDANNYLNAHGYDSSFTNVHPFITTSEVCEGYVTWGSNHGYFNEQNYANVKFHPGAIAETYVSTSARTLTGDVQGQSEIGPLIHSGVTGVKGYVSEPYTLALCNAAILFERYVNGFNLAESFYAASPVIEWKGIVVGDPLCAPYSKG